LLRESLDLSDDGGVLFLEAAQTPMMDGGSGSDCSASDNSGPATVLSMSTNDDPFAPRAGSMAAPPASVDRSFLRRLLRRYPQGKLWSLHRDGLISTSDDDDQPSRDNPTFNTSQSPLGGVPSINVAKPLGKRHKVAENSMLNQYFPGATQIMFVPLWNAVTSQWFAGCFCWTTVETQVFTSAVDLSSVLGFGSSIMAEYSRVESLIADRQKGDFIGSISHELRSPLHGILAAAEFLNSTKLDEFQESLLETLHACGRTLLDTMNQVLDFSKVVSLERTWKSMKRRKESPLDFKGTDRLASHLDTYIVTDLSILAEEVVEGVSLGLAYGQNSTAAADLPVVLSHSLPKSSASRDVEVVVDVAHRDWVYRTQPGALRRIIMNIFGNAMKYTDEGRVTLSLDASSHSEGRSRRQGLEDLVTLTVTDTGRGISEEFLRDRLYTPFAQENSLAVGTGLGLSIVRSLVKALNGNIRVRSRPGEGTMVRVSLPLARPVGEEDPPVEPHEHQIQQREILEKTISLREQYTGKRAAIWGADPDHIDQDSTWAEIGRYLREWFNVELVPWPTYLPLDMLIVEETELPVLRHTGLSATLPSLLILGSKAADYSKARSEWLGLASSVDIIRRPCGPHKLARSVMKCFQNSSSTVVTPASVVHQNPMEMAIRTPPITSAITSPVDESFSVDIPIDQSTSSKEAVRSRAASLAAVLPDAPSVIYSPPEVIAAIPPPPPLGENNTKSTQLARVLVVDDNRINLNLMMTFMKKRNLTELASAENGKLAVEAVERVSSGFDIIFMDISMPVMNGFEATRAIRAIERERDGCGPAIIIALTGLSSSRDESEALASGVDMFLTKPVSFREVSRLLNEWERDRLLSERRQIT
jgi:signal transduction histidine kinase/CheY-like chemotaxis protein